MPSRFPYLQFRGGCVTFRIAVPSDLRALLGFRELTKALPAVSRHEAVPMALEFAASSKRMFARLRGQLRPEMIDQESNRSESSHGDCETTGDTAEGAKRPALHGWDVCRPADLTALIARKRHQIEVDALRDALQAERDENALLRGRLKKAKPHLYRLKAMDQLLARGGLLAATAAPSQEKPVKSSKRVPLLSDVISSFMSKQDATKPMFKKYRAALNLLALIVPNRPVDQIRQADIDEYFELLCRLPSRWADRLKSDTKSIRELAAADWDECISPKTFKDGYLASIRPFLQESRRLFGDQGFPTNLTTDGIRYSGQHEASQRKQRAMSTAELRRLFEGEEFVALAHAEADAHKYWLPLVGLYTGARVNELCQINPQTDVGEEAGIAFLHITEQTEADDGVTKSVKTESSRRKVPVHPRLIELGFLAYVDALRRSGKKLLFSGFKPKNGRASGKAEVWFRDFLRETGLRDETPQAQLVGFHAFRHTFLNQALNQGVDNAYWITGHAATDVSPVVRGYQGALRLEKLREIIVKIDFDIAPPVWMMSGRS
jgi:integrase